MNDDIVQASRMVILKRVRGMLQQKVAQYRATDADKLLLEQVTAEIFRRYHQPLSESEQA